MSTVTELKGPINEVFARRASRSAGITLTWAESDGAFLCGVARFRDAKEKARKSRDYGNVVLREEWLALTLGVSRLEATVFPKKKGNAFEFGEFQPNCTLERRTPDGFENLTGWPEWVITARRAGNPAQPPSGVAVSHGLPPFEYATQAVDDWLFARFNSNGGQIQHLGELLLAIPDTRGSLKSVRWEGTRLSGTIHTRASHAELELQVMLDTEDGRTPLAPIRPVPSAFIWDTPRSARFAEVYLVHSSRDLMGKARLSPGAEVSVEAKALSVAEQARRDLVNWESHLVEFKPFIDKKDGKLTEVVESAIAFANSDGGRIYVGVGKDREPEGEKAFRRVLQSDKPEALADYIKHLDELIRERVKPVPQFKVESLSLLGLPVLVIVIEQGRDKPYSTVPGNDVFIRPGAFNRRPDPKTELPRLYDDPSAAALSTFLNDVET